MLDLVLQEIGLNHTQITLFRELLAVSGVNVPEFENSIEALDWLKSVTQEKWLRKPGSERWDLVDNSDQQNRRKEMMGHFHAMGLIDELQPSSQHYDHVLILGALQSRIQTRIKHVEKIWKDGVRFEKIALLGGQRPIKPELEPIAEIIGTDATELDIMKAVYVDQSKTWENNLQNTQYVAVDTPMQTNQQGQLVRPTTIDTIKSWLNSKPTPGNVLVISNQPYVAYQHSVVRSVLPETFRVDSVGHAASEQEKISTILDSLARQIYADYPRLKNSLLKKVYEENVRLLIENKYQRVNKLPESTQKVLVEQLWWVQENTQFTPQADALYSQNSKWLNHLHREIPRALCRIEMLLLLRSCDSQNLASLYEEFTADQGNDKLSIESFLALSKMCQLMSETLLDAQIRASAIASVTLSPKAQKRANFFIGESKWPYDSVQFSGCTITLAGSMYTIYETADATVKEFIKFCFPNDSRHWRHAFFLENGTCLEALKEQIQQCSSVEEQANLQKNIQIWLDYWMINALGFEGHIKSMTGSHFMTESVFQRLQLLNASILKTLDDPKNFRVFEDYAAECLNLLKVDVINKSLALFIVRIANMANIFNPSDANQIRSAIQEHQLMEVIDAHQQVFTKCIATYVPEFLQNIAQEASSSKHLSLIKALAWVTKVLGESTTPITSFRTADQSVRQTLLAHDFECKFKINEQGELESVSPVKNDQKQTTESITSLTM